MATKITKTDERYLGRAVYSISVDGEDVAVARCELGSWFVSIEGDSREDDERIGALLGLRYTFTKFGPSIRGVASKLRGTLS